MNKGIEMVKDFAKNPLNAMRGAMPGVPLGSCNQATIRAMQNWAEIVVKELDGGHVVHTPKPTPKPAPKAKTEEKVEKPEEKAVEEKAESAESV